MGEVELALEMSEYALGSLGIDEFRVAETIPELREELFQSGHQPS